MLPPDSTTSEAQSSATSGKAKPDKAKLKDALKPNSLIIALVASVLFILLGWYIFILEPALRGSNPLDIRLTKKPFSNTPFSQKLEPKTEVETPLAVDEVAPPNTALQSEGKSEVVQLDNPPPRTKSSQKTTSRKPAKSTIAKTEKAPTAQIQDSQTPRNEPEGDHKKEDIKAVNVAAEEAREENQNEDAAQKIKSFADKWKESFLTPTTQPICTQVQIALNQCPN